MTRSAALLDGRVALVTGVGPGLGRAISLQLAAHGADVVLAARTASRLEEVAAEVEATTGARALAVPTDVTNRDHCDRLVEAAASHFGQIDVLVNSAFAEEDWRTFDGFDLERWKLPFNVNLWGSLGVTRAVIPRMQAVGGGSVVMITTLSIRTVNPTLGGYASSKGALTTAAQVLAKEFGRQRIRVNCVAPGHIWADSLRSYFEWLAERQGITPHEVYQQVASLNCLPRLATPKEIAGAVVFLASDLSRALTGQTLHVDCGRYLH